MDADSYAVQDPETLFNSKPYKEFGVLLFQDLWSYACHFVSKSDDVHPWPRLQGGLLCGQSGYPDHIVWNFLGREWKPDLQHSQETQGAQIYISRKRHVVSLLLAKFFATNKFAQSIVYGDKEAWRLAFLYSEEPWHYVKDPMSQIGVIDASNNFNRNHVAVTFDKQLYFIEQRKYKGSTNDLIWLQDVPNVNDATEMDYCNCPPDYDPIDLGHKQLTGVKLTTMKYEEYFKSWDGFWSEYKD